MGHKNKWNGKRLQMIIYKLLRIAEWQRLKSEKETLGAPNDLMDGYIHFSTKDQVKETASKHFAGVTPLQLLACNGAAMKSHLKWEPARGEELFPHLYCALTLNDVVWHKEIIFQDGLHRFPESLE